MDQQEGLDTNIPPLFTKENYAYLSMRMKCHLMSLGWMVWATFEGEYKNIDDNLPTDSVELGQYEDNAKALNAILSGLENTVFVKFIQCKTAKQACDKLKIIYEGASKFKESQLQTYRWQFESLKMKEEENIGEYLLRVDEVVNAIRGLGGKLKERKVFDKVLRTFPMKYDTKVFTLEE